MFHGIAHKYFKYWPSLLLTMNVIKFYLLFGQMIESDYWRRSACTLIFFYPRKWILLASCLLIRLHCNTSRRSWVWILVKPTPWALIVTEEKVQYYLCNDMNICKMVGLTRLLWCWGYSRLGCLIAPDIKAGTKKKPQAFHCLLCISVGCIIWNRHSSYFTPLHSDTFALTSL